MQPKDISNYSNIHYDTNVWNDYQWVKVAKQYPSGSWSKWEWARVDQLSEFREQRQSTLIFYTINHYIKPNTEALQLCDLCFECDVSGETDAEKALHFRMMQNSVDELYGFFADLGIEDGQMRFFFTGGRSIHVVVMHQVFGVEPMVQLNSTMKHIAKHFNDGLLTELGHHELDLSLYANPKMFRMPNSYYPKYDAWKIELYPSEIMLPEEELRQLATEPRLPLYNLSNIPKDPIPDAVEWYQERLEEYQEREKEREHIPIDPKAFVELTSLPACIADLRQNTIRANDTRNQATLLDATFCKSSGVKKDKAFKLINEWVQRIPDKLTDRRPGRQREIATKSVIESVFRGTKYKFACGYARALGLECDKEECPLYKQETFQNWNKRVRVLPNFTPTNSGVYIPIGKLRTELAHKTTENNSDVLIHAPPGSGKTETTIQTTDLSSNILYSPPRREMLEPQLKLINNSECRLIKPRDPIGDKPTQEDGPEAMELWEASALCPHYKQADALAAKRWNVAKELCSRRCDIGMARCKYWGQFNIDGSALAIQHYLYIPFHMKKLCESKPTIIFDEPDPASFIEQVEITPKTITTEIERWQAPSTAKFLSIIRSVIENNDDFAIGKAVLQQIINACDDNLEMLLDKVMGFLSVPEDYVAIEVDTISALSTDRAWLVIIGNEAYWIPRKLCFEVDFDSIDKKTIKIPYWLADQKGIEYDIGGTEIDAEEGGEANQNIPLNFLFDLVTVLYEEYQHFKEGKDFNSQLALTETIFKQKCLRINLRKYLAIGNCRLVCLDAFGDAELLSKLTGRQLESWTVPVLAEAEIIQIVDGYYGITTMWKKKSKDEGGGIPKMALKRLIKAAANITAQDPEGTLIVTWKLIHQHLEELQQKGEFDSRIAVDHFGNVQGSNKYEHYRQVIIIGAPSIQPKEQLQMAHAIYHDDEQPLDDTMVKDGNWRPYQYRDDKGNGYAVEVREYKDKRLNLLLKTYREYEIAQAAHRIRPLLYPGKKTIWLLTNLPIDELPPTKLTTLDDIIAETNPIFLAFKSEVARIQSEHSGVWMDYAKIRFRKHVIDINTIYEDAKANFPSVRTLERWFHQVVKLLGYESTIVTIGGNVRLKVYHDGNLDENKIRQLYVHIKEGRNND